MNGGETIADRPSAILRALRRSAAAFGVTPVVTAEGERPWASATFVGARHRIVLAPDRSPAFVAWLDALRAADLPLRGAIVADLAVDAPATVIALVIDADLA